MKPTMGDMIAWAACATLMLSPVIIMIVLGIGAILEDMFQDKIGDKPR